MKKSLIALAALVTTGAFAQSSVTLSGIMDAGVQYSSATAPGVSKIGIGAGNNNRLIFSGVEDLGGGLAATFAAQIRFDPTTGTNERGIAGFNSGNSTVRDANGTVVSGLNGLPGLLSAPTIGTAGQQLVGVNSGRPLFQGETRVGLRGAFGAIRLGRGLTALQAPNGSALDPWVVTTVASSVYAPGYASDYSQGGEGRTDGIFYDTPNFGGVTASLTYSPRKSFAGGKTFYSVALNYNNGPVVGLIGYEQNRFGDSLLNIGGNYNFGVAKAYLGFGRVKGGTTADRAGVAFLANAGATPGYLGGMTAFGQTVGVVGTSSTINSTAIGATIPLGAAKVLVGYSTYKSNIAGTARDNKLGLGLNYALSKRTSVYTDLASFTRKNNLAGANPATNNDRVTAFDLGIAHSF